HYTIAQYLFFNGQPNCFSFAGAKIQRIWKLQTIHIFFLQKINDALPILKDTSLKNTKKEEFYDITFFDTRIQRIFVTYIMLI
ncbi:hypothetical protein, partial [Bacteroides nordii]|uniref:hypothetical protein n=1 Tax=Bacteroides nordii TaxID=291645 RepID=UPI00399AAED8